MKIGSALKSKIVLCTFLIFPIFVNSCFKFTGYPDEWAPLQSSISECIDISGIYYNLPKSGTQLTIKYYQGLSLTHLFQVPLAGIYNGTRVVGNAIQIELISNDKIKIITRKGDILINERLLDRSNGDFYCTSDMIKISGPSHSESDASSCIVFYGSDWSNYFFSKNKDGALILKEVESEFVGVCIGVLPIPFAKSQVYWSLYEPVVNVRNDS